MTWLPWIFGGLWMLRTRIRIHGLEEGWWMLRTRIRIHRLEEGWWMLRTRIRIHRLEEGWWMLRIRIRIHGLEEGTKISVYHMEGEWTEKLLYLGCGLPNAALYLDDRGWYCQVEFAWIWMNRLEYTRGSSLYHMEGKMPGTEFDVGRQPLTGLVCRRLQYSLWYRERYWVCWAAHSWMWSPDLVESWRCA